MQPTYAARRLTPSVELPTRRPARSRGYAKRIARPALGVVFILALLFFAIRALLPGATHLTWGFSAYYTGARLLLQGADMRRLYDPAWFRAQVAAFGIAGPQASDVWFVNPPTTALLMVPVALLPPSSARLAWTALNLAILPVTLWLILRALAIRLRLTEWALLAIGVLAFNPLHENFRWGQAYLLLLLLHALFLYGHLRGKDWLTGSSLATMLLLKSYGAFPFLFLLFRRRWRAIIYALSAAGLVVLVTLPRLTGSLWRTYLLEEVPKIRAYAGMGMIGYQTLTSFLEHLLSYDPVGSPTPLIDAPRLAAVLAAALTGLILITTLHVCRRRDPQPERGFEALALAAFVAISIPLAPIAEEHHFTVLILPLTVFGVSLLRSSARARTLLAGIVSYGLLALPLPFMHAGPLPRWRALALYPKLYGALLLWLALILHLREQATSPRGAHPHHHTQRRGADQVKAHLPTPDNPACTPEPGQASRTLD